MSGPSGAKDEFLSAVTASVRERAGCAGSVSFRRAMPLMVVDGGAGDSKGAIRRGVRMPIGAATR
jgi:hypothetical protein